MSNNLTLKPIQQEYYLDVKEQFVELSDEQTYLVETAFAIQAFKKNPYLQGADAFSVRDAILNVCRTGLTLNPVLNYAYLVPRWNSKQRVLECHLEPGYQGLIKLATDQGAIVAIEVQLIFENDLVEVDLASDKKIVKHVPAWLLDKESGKIVGGYSKAKLKDGTIHVEIMKRKDIEDIREYSEAWKAFKDGKVKTCVWDERNTISQEMYRKTILKRHFKYLPKTYVPEELQKAIKLDNEQFDFPMSYGQATYIESLMQKAVIPEQREREIYQAMSVDSYTQKEAGEVIEYLLENQRDPISSGDNYQARDIVKKLDKDIN